MATEKLKRQKSPGIDQTPAELIEAGGKTNRSEIYKLINSIGIRRICLSSGRSRSLYLFIRKVIKQIIIIETYHFYQLLSNILLSKVTSYPEEIIGVHQCGFRRNRTTTDHIQVVLV
jgi:hypothetical protein